MPRMYGAPGSDGILICTECRKHVFVANDQHLPAPVTVTDDWGGTHLEAWSCEGGQARCNDCNGQWRWVWAGVSYEPDLKDGVCRCGWSAS